MKNKHLLFSLLSFLLLAMTACQDDQEEPARFFYGNYNLQAIAMDQPIALTNSGESSQDFLIQLEELIGSQENRMTFVEDIDDQMFFAFYSPTVLTEQGGVPIVRFAAENVVLKVELDDATDQFQIIEQLPSVVEFGEIVSIKLLDQLTLEVTLNQSLYDFSDNEWKDVVVDYQFVRGPIST